MEHCQLSTHVSAVSSAVNNRGDHGQPVAVSSLKPFNAKLMAEHMS